jgi:hypothetical protein
MRSRRHKLQVSTFPFLAVLLCAMGALLLVLLVMDRRAHDAARARAVQAARRAAEESARDAEARRTDLERARDAALAAHQQEREAEHARLAGKQTEVEGQIQSVRDQMAQAAARLRAEQDDAAAVKQKTEAERAQAAAEEQALVQVRGTEEKKAGEAESSRTALARMTADLARLEQVLADLKAAREKEQKTYSVVPYNGNLGDNRRPLYVECAAAEVVFYPDRLSLADSRSETELQAEIARRLTRQKEQLPAAQAAAFSPYLMLLVRPDGVVSYYRLREALRGLKIDFGYEFIDKDWVLDFPTDGQATPAQSWMTAAKPPSLEPTTAPGPRLVGVPTASGPDQPSSLRSPGAGRPQSGIGSSTISPEMVGKPGSAPSSFAPGAKSVILNGSGKSEGNGAEGLFATPGAGQAVPPAPGLSDFGSSPGAGPHSGTADGAPGGIAGPGGPLGKSAGSGLAAAPGSPGSGTSPATPPGSAQPTPGALPGPGTASESATAVPGRPGGAPRLGPNDPTVGGSPPPPPGPDAAGSSGPSGPTGTLGAPVVAGSPRGTVSPGTPVAAAANGNPPPWGTNAGSASSSPVESGPMDPAKNPPGSPPAAGPRTTSSKSAPGDNAGAGDGSPSDAFLEAPPPPLPKSARPPAPLRPARLSGDRDWVLYVECKEEGVVIYPTRLLIPASALSRPSGSNPLLQSVQQLIDRKQATVRTGEAPYRPDVRFLVHPDAGRTYHLAYPTLDALAAPKTAQYLGPDDDVATIVSH